VTEVIEEMCLARQKLGILDALHGFAEQLRRHEAASPG
jgi:hypothetical protein